MDGDAPLTSADPLAVVARSTGTQPLYRIDDPGDGGLSAAKWKFEDVRITTGGIADGILSFRTSGSAAVTRRTSVESVRKRPAIGSATYAAPDSLVRWTTEGCSESLHIYIPQARVQRFAERELSAPSTPRIDEFFAVIDPWLQGYLQILTSEFEIFAGAGQPPDSLFLAHTEDALLRHLLRRHSDAGGRQLEARGRRSQNPLRSSIMRRVQEYIDTHVAEDISLQHLADLACMSPGHFLRSFRVASGMTPYQYVLEQRLQSARSMLTSGRDPVSRIARRCGFKTPSHLSVQFHARFGMSPSRYRAATGTGPAL
jgi:AraC-like DNA-binding protein